MGRVQSIRKAGMREYRIGLGRRLGGQGLYIWAKDKDEAYRLAIKSYMRTNGATRSYTKTRIKKYYVVVWRNADGSVPAWRKRK